MLAIDSVEPVLAITKKAIDPVETVFRMTAARKTRAIVNISLAKAAGVTWKTNTLESVGRGRRCFTNPTVHAVRAETLIDVDVT